MEIALDVEPSDNDSDNGDSRAMDGNNIHRPDIDSIIKCTLVHDILLDSATNSEDEDVDIKDESTDYEAEDSGSEDEDVDTAKEDKLEIRSREDGDGRPVGFKYGFDGIELGFVPPPPTCETENRQSQQYTAGCMWTAEDWSCSYDAVFMSFWSLYEQSSAGWRDDWKQHMPDWNTPLGNNFDHLILLMDTLVSVRDRAEWFSHYRDRFRDQLSQANPRLFPRRGPLPASASRILGLMFGRDTGPYLEQDLVCSTCGALSRAEPETCLLTTGLGRNCRTSTTLHTIWERFSQRSRTDASQHEVICSHCRGQNKVRALRMPDVPWIWFERERDSPVQPSLALTFNSPPQRLSYSLRAIIYAGGNHFTIRFRERSGSWWKHDSRLWSGVPQSNDIQSEAELLTNDTCFACILIYRRDDY